MIRIEEKQLTQDILDTLIRFSFDWENEDITNGYRQNTKEDIEGNRIFLAYDEDEIIGYLFGQITDQDLNINVLKNIPYFEVNELYVIPSRRSEGVGTILMQEVEAIVKKEVDLIFLATSTKNAKAVLHFYIDCVDMTFHSAVLYKRLHENHETSCGAIVYRKMNDTFEYLLIQSIYGHWDFPKGHVEGNETEVETAMREIKEETGLSVEIDTGFREIVSYEPKEKVFKDVIYFLAKADETIPKAQEEEVLQVVWCKEEEARARITYETTRNIFEKAVKYLYEK